jgi:hypothetical protein
MTDFGINKNLGYGANSSTDVISFYLIVVCSQVQIIVTGTPPHPQPSVLPIIFPALL